MAPTPDVGEVFNRIAQKLLESLPAYLKPTFGSVFVRIIFQDGKVVKVEGGIETAQKE